ncbi:MAG: hypothetical protein GEU91_18520 [Rhizobiales bacterium]|nr:hypothetical protein [Hyphomicrobiales bacterium]
MLHETISPRWSECIVAATGPSLTPGVADACHGHRVVAVNDAYRLLPFADVLYACDTKWWDVHAGCSGFAGERWSCHGDAVHNDKRLAAERYGLMLVRGRDAEGFSLDPSRIHYGSNSGFQAINLAILFGAKRIVLVGFDMRVNGTRHFFGDHPSPLLNSSDYVKWVPIFARAARMLPPEIEIINATPGSALTCFPMMDLADGLVSAAA